MTPDRSGSGQVEAAASGNAIAGVIREFIRLILQHLALAGVEFSESGAGLGWATVLTVLALLTGFTGLILLLAGAALAFALLLPLWAAFLSIGVAALLAALGFFLLARAQFRRCTLMPERALASLRQNLFELGEEWR